MYLILAESELERVPKEVLSEKQVQSYSKHVGKPADKLLLDSSLFYRAVKTLPQGDRRGRPDLIHTALTIALDSPAARKGKLEVFVHTRNDQVIRIKTETRPPRNYNRFIGLMEQLFETKRVPPEGEPLMEMKEQTLQQLIGELQPKEVVLFDAKGEKVGHSQLKAIPHGAAVLIGGFPHGEFKESTKKLATKTYSISEQELLAATAVAYLIAAIE